MCRSCGEILDADLNGALNHEADIPPIPFSFSRLQLNKSGFFWLETGLFDSAGQELTVPDVKKTNGFYKTP